MKRIIAFTDSVTTCECCGKSNLKGTYCVEINGVELYYGSTCTFKKHGFSEAGYKAVVKAENAAAKKAAIAEQKAAWNVYLRDDNYDNYISAIRNIQIKYPAVWSVIYKQDLRNAA